jgi:hypothetical protein
MEYVFFGLSNPLEVKIRHYDKWVIFGNPRTEQDIKVWGLS